MNRSRVDVAVGVGRRLAGLVAASTSPRAAGRSGHVVVLEQEPALGGQGRDRPGRRVHHRRRGRLFRADEGALDLAAILALPERWFRPPPPASTSTSSLGGKLRLLPPGMAGACPPTSAPSPGRGLLSIAGQLRLARDLRLPARLRWRMRPSRPLSAAGCGRKPSTSSPTRSWPRPTPGTLAGSACRPSTGVSRGGARTGSLIRGMRAPVARHADRVTPAARMGAIVEALVPPRSARRLCGPRTGSRTSRGRPRRRRATAAAEGRRDPPRAPHRDRHAGPRGGRAADRRRPDARRRARPDPLVSTTSPSRSVTRRRCGAGLRWLRVAGGRRRAPRRCWPVPRSATPFPTRARWPRAAARAGQRGERRGRGRPVRREITALVRAELGRSWGCRPRRWSAGLYRWRGGNRNTARATSPRPAHGALAAAQAPGVFVTGSALYGVGVATVIAAARTAAERALAATWRGLRAGSRPGQARVA